MSKPNRPLSISAYQTYMENPAVYKASYIDRIRAIVQMSYFIFGKAVDLGCNALLLRNGDARSICDQEIRRLLIEPVEFIPSDYDGELLDDDAKSRILKECRKAGYKGDDVDSLMTSLLSKPFKELSGGQRRALAHGCYESLKAKAFLMLDAYSTKVLPQLSDIRDVQKEYKWVDQFGNEFVGIIDFRARFNGVDVTADNKTASNPSRDYTEDVVRNSIQFSVYNEQTKDTHSAYFVMDKRIKKNRIKTCTQCGHIAKSSHKTCPVETGKVRCDGEWLQTIKPEADIVIRFDQVSGDTQKLVKRAMSETANAIKAGIFPLNVAALKKRYGDKEVVSPYYEYFLNGSMNGLKIEEKKES